MPSRGVEIGSTRAATKWAPGASPASLFLSRQEEEEEEDCGQGFGEDESLLPPLRTKDEILVPSQKLKVGSLLAAIAKGEGRVPVGYHRNGRRPKDERSGRDPSERAD